MCGKHVAALLKDRKFSSLSPRQGSLANKMKLQINSDGLAERKRRRMKIEVRKNSIFLFYQFFAS